mmetsp:Transcript_32444/g.44007  ORF Transcript_32444/g.44007 Transcript_32444/m.44007 type:complete len:89 (-) Transcript_32444:193-459(-)
MQPLFFFFFCTHRLRMCAKSMSLVRNQKKTMAACGQSGEKPQEGLHKPIVIMLKNIHSRELLQKIRKMRLATAWYGQSCWRSRTEFET